MTIKPIDSLLKEYVRQLKETGIQKAVELHKNLMQSCLGKSHFEKSKIILDEENKIEAEQEASEYPFYIQNHSSEQTLLLQFSNRKFLMGVDESEILINAVCHGHYALLLHEELSVLRKDIPKYSYSQFIKGVDCPYFMEFENFYNVERTDYYKIRDWQARTMISIIQHESQARIRDLQEHCRKLKDPLVFLNYQSNLIEENLTKTEPVASEIKSSLKDIYFLKDYPIDQYDEEQLVFHFKVYLGESISYKRLSTISMKKPVRLIKKNDKGPISNEHTLFLMINSVADWLEKVLKGRSWKKELHTPDFATLLKDALERADREVAVLENELETNAYDPKKSREEVLKYLVEQLELCRDRFNRHQEKYYFLAVKDEMKDVIERLFTTNCFFGLNPHGQVEALVEAMIIQNISWRVVQIHYEIFEKHKIPMPDADINHYEIISLIHKMVLDKESYNEFRKSMDDFMDHFHNYCLPMEIHFQNSRESMENVFHKCMNRMTAILDDAEQSAKILYLQSRLKQLRHRELEWKAYAEKKYFEKERLKFNGLFVEFLQIEAEFIKQTHSLKDTGLLNDKSNKLITRPTFESVFEAEKGKFLLALMEDLGITVGGICKLGERKKGAIRGVVDAILENNFVTGITVDTLCRTLAEKIGLSLRSSLDVSNISEQIRKKATVKLRDFKKDKVLSG